jgi:hypothetical protein
VTSVSAPLSLEAFTSGRRVACRCLHHLIPDSLGTPVFLRVMLFGIRTALRRKRLDKSLSPSTAGNCQCRCQQLTRLSLN